MSILHNCIPLAKMQMANQAKQFSYSDLIKYYIHAIQKDNSVPEQDFIIKLIGKLFFTLYAEKNALMMIITLIFSPWSALN